MRILVTGAAGFVGKNLLRGFPATWSVTALTRQPEGLTAFCEQYSLTNVQVLGLDLCDKHAVKAALGDESFTACVHLAANGDPRLAAEHPSRDVHGNVVPLLILLESGVKIGRFIHFSSGSVYEGHTGLVGADTPLRTYTPYSITKQAAESYVKYFRSRGSIGGYVIIRFFGCYGLYEAERKVYRRLVRAFALGKDASITLYGDGSNMIYAMYASDAVEAVLAVLRSERSDVTVDLCGPEAMNIREVVATALGAFQVKPAVTFTGEAPIERHTFRVSNTAFKEAFGFEPRIELAAGFKLYREAMIHGE